MGRPTKLNRAEQALHLPAPPADLPAEAKALWKTSVAARPASEWSPADQTLLALYVHAAIDVRRMNSLIEREGEVVDGRINPRVQVRAYRERLLLDVAKRLRLTPCSRYTAQRVGELHQHATRAREVAAALDSGDLLAKPRSLQ